ncbi:MAG TPA: arginine--tRNA ligase [Phycisphaerales bacterium]|nr:arginine--tRNA ligase [Phycisphaerales bacterium]
MNLRKTLEERLGAALAAAGAPGSPAVVKPAARAQFGDYQANGVMGAAKTLKTNPRQLAEKVLAAAQLDDLAEKVEPAGPGFLNITLSRKFLETQLAVAARDDRLAADTPARRTVVVDYSGPNLAKEMHVGHLRSTIIGDALARILEFLGHRVVRQNHVGDWGTQFGMLLAYWNELTADKARKLISDSDLEQPARVQALHEMDLPDLEEFYKQAKKRFDEDAEFREISRKLVVGLQSGKSKFARGAWESFIKKSLAHCEKVYDRLGVRLGSSDVHGESFYNDYLPRVLEALSAKGLLAESQGAQCVFLDEFKGKDGEPLPVIVRKSDGGFLYATTDLAALWFRAERGLADKKVDWQADRVLYVTDSRQELHFRQVFAVARRAGFVPEGVSLEHVGFGMMLGDDGKPFKTRTGGTVKLMDMLSEAETRAFELVTQKSPDLPEPQRREIARAVGIGAVKYADLSQNRATDYVFSWDKMLSLEGNTAPYMQYAYARIRSIFRKGEDVQIRNPSLGPARDKQSEIRIEEPAERVLAVKLLQFPETLEAAAAECLPNLLCQYLYELAGAFMGFYENCPVLKSEGDTRASRLALCELTARTIQKSLDLLGIETLEQM